MDSNTLKWLLDELNKYQDNEQLFAKRALLEQTKSLVKEQSKRINERQDELDGRMWSPDKW
ncbi:hypothetical protein WR164_04820 [Philodulcilactobacillus myokoensis]|uniref:Uncharacterized protein n=1 Tax=Philodulcilactobacillus myokoensis TaxID=2929573 RepID=A0A9W6B0R6_9LACO|nr:hypothetical protein [Philodulcilactobacillus myokoensis]GLB46503.1 hypothetical protein WR164_04820 [Philodulcilactobacillus myokoensis]